MLTKEEIDSIPQSFDVIGDILIFADFPENLVKKEKEIGSYILKKLKNVKVVAKKTKNFSGTFRTAKLKIIAGEKRKETLHRENNCVFKLNVETCYFSPRLGNERLRIAKQIKKNEVILVMFSGVAVYPITLSKLTKAREIYGIEINPMAHKYAQENLILNKIKNIRLIKGDARKVMLKMKIKFDRIIMPLPKDADKFLDLAFSKIKKNGIIHFYYFLREDDIPEIGLEKIKEQKKKFKLLRVVRCGQIAPRKYRVCFDIRVL